MSDEPLSHWDYRIVHHTKPDGAGGQADVYEVHEVYYSTDGTVSMWSEDAMKPYGESLDWLKNDLQWMTQALDKPVLERDDLPTASTSSETDAR